MSAEAVIQKEEQSVVFKLRSEYYGIDIFRVVEINRMREITPIPQTEAHIRGLVNLRGKTIPVIDLGTRFGLGETESQDATRIIVVDSEAGNVGIMVDAVREVVTLAGENIEGPPAVAKSLSDEFVRGVAKQETGLITLLDLDKALVA